jgi:hypothetical protein
MDYNVFMSESEKRSLCFELMVKAVGAMPDRIFYARELAEGAKVIYEYIFGDDIDANQ